MNWKVISDDYLNYLRSKENRIPNTNYGEGKMKPFFGELMKIDNLVYVTQVSSPKPRHIKMPKAVDFYKLYKQNKLLAVVNLNYMFPVPLSEINDLEYKNIGNFITFEDEIKKAKYITLLKLEMNAIKKLDLEKAAQKVYGLKCNKPNASVSQRCFDFKQLEEYAKQFKSIV